jgi:hypothetical protein
MPLEVDHAFLEIVFESPGDMRFDLRPELPLVFRSVR